MEMFGAPNPLDLKYHSSRSHYESNGHRSASAFRQNEWDLSYPPAMLTSPVEELTVTVMEVPL